MSPCQWQVPSGSLGLHEDLGGRGAFKSLEDEAGPLVFGSIWPQ